LLPKRCFIGSRPGWPVGNCDNGAVRKLPGDHTRELLFVALAGTGGGGLSALKQCDDLLCNVWLHQVGMEPIPSLTTKYQIRSSTLAKE
jgi:hypothetical protein